MNTDEETGGLGQAMTRRAALKLAAGAGMALLAGGALVERAGATAYFRTTRALNLRARPSMSGSILLVIPAGARVTNLSDTSSGFRRVSYQSTTGWAFGSFLVEDPPSDRPDYRIIGETFTTTAVNLRAGASRSARIVRVLARSTRVSVSDQEHSGYRFVIADGYLFGWVYEDFLGAIDTRVPRTFRTDRDVNLRAEPHTSARVLRVVPRGATVTDYDLVMANGFRGVDYRGTAGWIFDDHLGAIDEQGPLTFRTDRDVNLRAEPHTSARVLKVVPRGSTVTDYDLVMANGFRGVDYRGTVGWIFDDHLDRV